MKVLTYEEWLIRNPDVKEIDCDECEGKGWFVCDQCNQDVKCRKCKGSGHAGLSMYNNQNKKDKEFIDNPIYYGFKNIG